MPDNGFEALAKAHLPALYGWCMAATCDPDEAEDLAAETLSRAARAFPRLRDPGRFPAWLIGIAKRARWTRWRRKKRDPLAHRGNPAGTGPPGDLPDGGHNPYEHVAHKERFAETLRALRRLSRPLREVVVLRYFEELSYAEMAARLGVSVDAVDQRLTRARRQLARHLAPLEKET